MPHELSGIRHDYKVEVPHNHIPEKVTPRVAIHSITGCAGCQLTIYFIKDALLKLLGAINIVAAPMIKSKNEEGPYDICFVEGSVSCEDDLEHLKKWREQSKYLVALGTCATHGNVQGMVHYQNFELAKKRVYKEENPINLADGRTPILSTAIDQHVEVDFHISGCPPDEIEILKFIKTFLLGARPAIYNEPVCVECTLRQTRCILEDGKECLGPVIRGGCNALCPAVGHPCTGCRGPTHECNVPQIVRLLSHSGISEEIVRTHLQKYAGKEYEELGVHLVDDDKKPFVHLPPLKHDHMAKELGIEAEPKPKKKPEEKKKDE